MEIVGFTENNEALFKYTNKDQELVQTFGVTLKYYKARQVADDKNETLDGFAEGAYLLLPTGPSVPYSKINPDVAYEAGQTLEQWTIRFMDDASKAFGIIKIRFSPAFKEMIEFEVELNGIPLDDKQGKDVTVNWKMYDGFNQNKTFWTDTNGLEMAQRILDYQPTYKYNPHSK